jgi:hypothetical protein
MPPEARMIYFLELRKLLRRGDTMDVYVKDQHSETFQKDWKMAQKMIRDWKIKNFLKNLVRGKKTIAKPRQRTKERGPVGCNIFRTEGDKALGIPPGLFYTIYWANGTESTIRLKELPK